MFKRNMRTLFFRWLRVSLIVALLWMPMTGVVRATPAMLKSTAEKSADEFLRASPLRTPPPPAELLADLTPPPSPAPPLLPQAEVELREGMALLELARQQGPEAVLALRDTLRGPALDAAMPEILAAHRQVMQAAPPRPATAPVSAAEELAALQALDTLDASRRARALAFHTDPAENAPVESSPVPLRRHTNAPTANLTVGDGCTYATIAAAIAAANPGDTLLIEGGRTFTENLTIPINLTLQGGYAGCASASTVRTTVDGSNASFPVIIVQQSLVVSLQNLNLTNGSTGLEGGGIRFAKGTGTGTLNLSNVHVYGNSAQWGGGLWVGIDAEVTGENVHIYNNTATNVGGGVRLYGGRATFENSAIYDNVAPRGAGVDATREEGFTPRLTLPTNTDIYDNAALTGNGFGGGVYLRQGVISLADCSDIHSNHALAGGGAYLITSTLTIAGDCSAIMLNTATGNGGGVYAQGSTVNVRDSAQVYSNTAQTGGGAYLDNSSLRGDKALIHYNTATGGHGGGVFATKGSLLAMDLGSYACIGPRCSQLSYNTSTNAYGGGVFANFNSEVDLRQTFVEGNTAEYGGGIYAHQGQVYLYNVLVAGNNATGSTGGGIRLLNDVTFEGAHNTIAYNDAGRAATGRAIDIGASTLALRNSIVWGHVSSINAAGQTVTCSNIQGGYTGADNLNVDPLFVAPGSGDFHLQATSPVIDRCATGEAFDFDNEPRPIVRERPATPYDMGADEFSVPRVGINGGGCAYGTVRQAIAAAADGDTLQVAADTFFEAIDISEKNLTIGGGYDTDCTTYITGTTILDAAYHSGSAVDIFNVIVTLRNLRITGGDSIGGGVDVDASSGNESQATLDNVHITGNTGTYGAGLYIGTRAVVTLTNSTRIEHNAASIHGGGARVWGKLVLTSWLGGITHNTAPHGGGVSVPGGVLEMRPGHVGYNQATAASGRGGGIHVYDGGAITVTQSSNVYRNSAYDGGGIYADDARVTLGAVIHSNTAANDGGGIYLNNGSTLTANSTRLGDNLPGRDNEATTGAGGGIYAQASHVEFNGLVYNNRAATQGGGIAAMSSAITLTAAYVGGTGQNQANTVTDWVFGAGLYFSNTHALLSNTVVASNTFSSGAGWGGGMVAWEGSVVTLTEGSRIENHYAPNAGWFGGAGAGLLVYSSTVTLDNSQILSNTADILGGGIYMIEASTLNVRNGSRIVNNHALNDYGGGVAAIGAPVINITDATLRDNTASTDGGAIYLEASTLNANNAIFQDNQAQQHGGAIAAYEATLTIDADYAACNPLTEQCSVFSGNVADSNADDTGAGGAIYTNDSALSIHHTYLHRNMAERGGAIYQVGTNALADIANTLMYSNTATASFGAGIRSEGGTFTVTHVTLANNVNGAGYSQSNTEGYVENSIAWGNTDGGFWAGGGTLSGTCNIDQSSIVGINVDPQFMSPGADENYRLRAGSPAIDACTTGLPLDLDNKARPIGDGYDMGAYEGAGETYIYLPLVLRNLSP